MVDVPRRLTPSGEERAAVILGRYLPGALGGQTRFARPVGPRARRQALPLATTGSGGDAICGIVGIVKMTLTAGSGLVSPTLESLSSWGENPPTLDGASGSQVATLHRTGFYTVKSLIQLEDYLAGGESLSWEVYDVDTPWGNYLGSDFVFGGYRGTVPAGVGFGGDGPQGNLLLPVTAFADDRVAFVIDTDQLTADHTGVQVGMWITCLGNSANTIAGPG